MALFLEADDIRRINELVCRGTTGARIRVSQRNDVVLELSMIDELLNHPNGGQKEIRRVWWCSEEGAFNTEVRLWANEPSANVDVSVWGDDAEAVSIRGAAIEELLRQCRPLYAPLAENHAARLLLTLVYPLAIVDLIYLGAKYGPTEFWAAAVSSPRTAPCSCSCSWRLWSSFPCGRRGLGAPSSRFSFWRSARAASALEILPSGEPQSS